MSKFIRKLVTCFFISQKTNEFGIHKTFLFEMKQLMTLIFRVKKNHVFPAFSFLRIILMHKMTFKLFSCNSFSYYVFEMNTHTISCVNIHTCTYIKRLYMECLKLNCAFAVNIMSRNLIRKIFIDP